MALSGDANYIRRGVATSRNEFGYAPSAGAVIYRGALLALTVAGTLQPIQVAGSVAFAGLASQASGTPNQPVALVSLVASLGTWGLIVPTITLANIGTYKGASVYATDDNTLTLTAGSNLQIGTVAGIDFQTGLTYVNLLGS